MGAQTIADKMELKRKVVTNVLDSLASVASAEVKKAGKFTIPGVAVIKTRVKPATKAGKREMFGKVVVVKAKPAKTVVKAFAVAALKKSVWVAISEAGVHVDNPHDTRSMPFAG